MAGFAPPLLVREPNHHSLALVQKAESAVRPMNQRLETKIHNYKISSAVVALCQGTVGVSADTTLSPYSAEQIRIQNTPFLLQRDYSWSKMLLNAHSHNGIWQTAMQVYLIDRKSVV